jgi:NADH-quinone oxidoreductase subunit D
MMRASDASAPPPFIIPHSTFLIRASVSERAMPELRTETMTVNMGPQHPSTHGVLRLVLELEGETVLNADTTIGFLHTGIEKTAEQKKWQQVIPLVERMDYLGAQSSSLAFCLSVERLLGVEDKMPQRVRDIRVLIAELQRIASHLVWLGTHALEIGAVSVMMYCFRERERLLNINEMLAGFRLFPSYLRIGGLREDLPPGFHEAVTAFLNSFPAALKENEDLLTKNQVWLKRTKGVGVLTAQDTMDYGLVGPIARGAGVGYDVRKAFPYSGYDTYKFDVPVAGTGDVFDRYQVRMEEMRQSVRISRQALERITPRGVYDIQDYRIVPPPKDKVYTEMEGLIQHFLIYSQGFTVPVGEAYVPIEGPRGEHGFTIFSDGTNRPWRIKLRAPSFYACQGLPKLIIGGMIADVIAVIGSTDVVMGDVDR